MVQFWAHKEVIFVHYCALQFAYCAVVIAEEPCLLRSFIVLLASFTVWVVACLFEATVSMADLESTRRTAFLKVIGLRSSCCSAMAIAVISLSKLVLLKLLKNKIIGVHALKFFYELWFYSKEWEDPQ